MTQVMNHHSAASGERSPFRGNANPPSGQNWYARMLDEKEVAYNQKRHTASAEKKVAALIAVSCEQVSQTHASSSLDVQRPL